MNTELTSSGVQQLGEGVGRYDAQIVGSIELRRFTGRGDGEWRTRDLDVARQAEYDRPRNIRNPPLRPWYSHKQGLCFADILRTAQRVLAPLDVLDPPALAEIPALRGKPETKRSKRSRRKGET